MSVLCERCGERKATFFYQETKNGVKKEIHLCSHCAGELGLSSEEIFTPFSLLSPFGVRKAEEEKICPRCGTSLSSVRKKGKFGCSICYDTFSSLLDLTPFVGAGYQEENLSQEKKASSEKKDPPSLLETMKKELKEALEKEEYEKAACLRDKIRAEEGRR